LTVDYLIMSHSWGIATKAHYASFLMEDMDLIYELQHTATHCNTLQHSATLCNTLQHSATHCNTLHHLIPQGIAKKGHYGSFLMEDMDLIYKLVNTAHTHCNVPITAKMRIFDDDAKSLQYAKMLQVCVPTAAHCNTLQHTATHCNTLQHTVCTHCNKRKSQIIIVNGRLCEWCRKR